jgi:hypothetical protein
MLTAAGSLRYEAHLTTAAAGSGTRSTTLQVRHSLAWAVPLRQHAFQVVAAAHGQRPAIERLHLLGGFLSRGVTMHDRHLRRPATSMRATFVPTTRRPWQLSGRIAGARRASLSDGEAASGCALKVRRLRRVAPPPRARRATAGGAHRPRRAPTRPNGGEPPVGSMLACPLHAYGSQRSGEARFDVTGRS